MPYEQYADLILTPSDPRYQAADAFADALREGEVDMVDESKMEKETEAPTNDYC